MSDSYKDLKCYAILPDKTVRSVNYSKMSDSGVSAVFFHFGRLFDESHNRMTTFIYPNFTKQVQQAIQYGMPYGFVADVYATSVEDASDEVSAMQVYIERYAPPLGVWLSLHLTMPTTINDMLMKRYIQRLSSLGLTNKLGLYVTRHQLTQITWPTFQELLALWLIDPVTDLSELDTLLTPDFFMLRR